MGGAKKHLKNFAINAARGIERWLQCRGREVAVVVAAPNVQCACGGGAQKGEPTEGGGEKWRLGLLLPHTMQYIFALAFVAFWQHFFCIIVDSYFFVFVRSFRIFVWISAASQKSFFFCGCFFFCFLFCALHDWQLPGIDGGLEWWGEWGSGWKGNALPSRTKPTDNT